MKENKQKIKEEAYELAKKENCTSEDNIRNHIIDLTQAKMQKKFEDAVEKCLRLWKTGCSWEIEEAVKQFAKEILKVLGDIK